MKYKMEAKQKGTNKFEVISDSGHTYQVSKDSCTCPHYLYRLAIKGEKCKHMIFISTIKLKEKEESEMLNFLKNKKIVPFNVLEEKFGNNILEQLNEYISEGEIYYDKKKDTYICME